jgi:hypothetical protein
LLVLIATDPDWVREMYETDILLGPRACNGTQDTILQVP